MATIRSLILGDLKKVSLMHRSLSKTGVPAQKEWHKKMAFKYARDFNRMKPWFIFALKES